MNICLVALTAAVQIFAAPTLSATAKPIDPTYKITDLGTLPGGHESCANALNDRGQIVGWSDGVDDKSTMFDKEMVHNHAVLWDHGKVRDLGLLKGFPYSAARGINRNGEIVGGWDLNYHPGNGGGPGGLMENFIWRNGKMTIIGGAAPPLRRAFGVNDHGQVAATAWTSGDHAALWTEKKTDLLPMPAGFTESHGYALNDGGVVVGSATKSNGVGLDYHAFLWRNGVAIDLGMLPSAGSSCEAFAINDKGQVAGCSNGHPFLWENGVMHDLGRYPLYPHNVPRSINNLGQVVGEGDDYSQGQHAILWRDSAVYDLNDLISAGSGWLLTDARAINNKGQIAGVGMLNAKQRAWLLTPKESR